MTSLAASRLSATFLSHWPVFAVLAGITVGMLAIALRRRASTSAQEVSTSTVVGWGCVFVAPPLIYVMALSFRLSVAASIFAAFLGAAVLMWVFNLVDEFVPPLVAAVATLFIGLAPPDVALAGFSSPSLLLLIGVFALAAVISSSGLSYRLMLRLVLALPDRPLWHQVALLGSGYLLSPVVPSTNARLSLLMPVLRDTAADLKLTPRGPAITALLASAFGGAILLGPMLATGKSANIAGLNLLPSQTRSEFGGIFWLCAAAVAALTVTVAHLIVVRRAFPTEHAAPVPRNELRAKLAEMGPLTARQRIAAGCALFFLVGSVAEPWHHVRPPYLAGCVLLVLLITAALRRSDFQSRIDWPMIFFLLGIDSLNRVMNYLGLSQSLARVTRHAFDFVGGSIGLFLLATLTVTLTVRLVLPVTAGMLTSALILLPVAAEQGIHPWICIFAAAIFSDIAIFRHQGTNGIVQIRAAGMFNETDERSFLRYNMLMNGARIAAVYASIPWWSWLGLV
jgi:di/tricarboxylate transporter